MSASNVYLADALLPRDLIEAIATKGIPEKSVLVVSEFLVNVVKNALENFQARCFKPALDPNPGDGGCQLRGYLLFRFCADGSFNDEASSLIGQIEKVKSFVAERCRVNRCLKKIPEIPPTEFFSEQFGKIEISRKMEFLLQCYLLAQTRQPRKTLENGVVQTETDPGLLGKKTLMNNRHGDLSGEFRSKITEIAQAKISESSLQFLIMEAQRIDFLPFEEKTHLLSQLAVFKRPLIERKQKGLAPMSFYQPKTFGFLFYEDKAILALMRENRGLIAFKSIVPKGKVPFQILLMRSPKKGEEFALLPDKDYAAVSNDTVIVFEAVINPDLSREEFAEKVAKIGASRLILGAAAIEDPFDRGSKLEEIKDELAREEITRYRQYAQEDGCETGVNYPRLMMLDHVYCNTVGAELPKQKEEKK